MSATRLVLVLALAGCGLAQPPLIYNRSILNAASFMPNRLPGGAIAQGSIFSLFGAHLGPTSPVQVSAFPLGTSLANVSISVTQATVTTSAIPLYVSASQINAIMPSNTPTGAVSVRVTYNGQKSNPMTAVVAQSAPGVFSARGTGFGPGIFFNFVSQIGLQLHKCANIRRQAQEPNAEPGDDQQERDAESDKIDGE